MYRTKHTKQIIKKVPNSCATWYLIIFSFLKDPLYANLDKDL